MEVFFDTTVLVAASERTHPHYAQAMPALSRVATGKDTGFISAHSIAEVYAALTRLPVKPRIHPAEAERIILENVLPNFEVVPLLKEDYIYAMNTMSTGGWIGAQIYDALLLRCAERSGARRIYTFNLAHFMQLAPASLHMKLCSP